MSRGLPTLRLLRLVCTLFSHSYHLYPIDSGASVYTWSEYKPSNADSLGFEFWPMLWGPSHVDSFNQLVVAGYGTTILGFNEYVFDQPRRATPD